MLYNSYLPGNFKDETVFNTIEIPLGTRSSFTLPDGTFVWLNAGSTLKYPLTFNRGGRHVELNGEAWFEVKKDENHPFVVSTADINIKVLGTSFNCSAYPSAGKIETALVEGKIEISGKSGKNRFLVEPGELAVFSKQERTIEKSQANLDKHIAWKSGKLMFRDDPMDKVIEKLGRWYRVEFQVDDPEILNYTYSATFSGESLDQVLKMLALSAPINFDLLPRERLDDMEYGPQIIQLTKK
jgi:ferric-dicitrate binding protein FerR (iron transport regulator)